MGTRTRLEIILSTLWFVLICFSTISHADDGTMKPVSNKDPYVCDPRRFVPLDINMSDLGFCNKSLPFEVRAKDLVDRMTLSEKARQMGNKADGVARLGLPPYNWWSEALHGVSYIGNGTNFTELNPGATSFPTVIHTAASFNKSLWKAIGQVVSTEARAVYNLEQGGLTFWSPNINPVRDPRWGRTTETPGEDPFLVGTYAANYVRGLQDIEGKERTDNPASRPLKVSSCCKHYAAYDVDRWHDAHRFTFDAKVTEQDMVETFLRPFEMCVKDGDASSIMCSYNKVNGIPTCADPVLLKQTIRGDWKLNGYIVSDCDSVDVIANHQHWLNYTAEDASAQALKAGLDLDCGWVYPSALENAVKQGKVSEAELDRSLTYLYVVLLRLGFFDGSEPSLTKLGKNDICSSQHIELAAEAAREGIVLLKNDGSNLPLKPEAVKTLAVIGPNANATRDMLGNYEGFPCRYVSPIKALSEYGKVRYEKGCKNHACKEDLLFPSAIEAAKQADVTIIVAGSNMSVEAEDLDRENLFLPGQQKELISQVANYSKGPVVLVLMTGGGFDITFAKNDPKIKSILWSGHPGMEGGKAIADVIFGKYNPGGRLPITWYPVEYVDKLPMTSMQLRPDDKKGYPGRTYKFYNGSTVYPFGYGKSYTSFSYNVKPTNQSLKIKLNRLQHCHKLDYISKSFEQSCPSVVVDDLKCNEKVSFEVEVKNEGDRDGSEVVVVYSQPPEGVARTHIKQVVAFERVFVPAKKSEKVKFELNACKSLSIVDGSGYTLLPSGSHKLVLGTSSVQVDVDVSYSR